MLLKLDFGLSQRLIPKDGSPQRDENIRKYECDVI